MKAAISVPRNVVFFTCRLSVHVTPPVGNLAEGMSCEFNMTSGVITVVPVVCCTRSALTDIGLHIDLLGSPSVRFEHEADH
jgi:hypothetical protein